MFYDVKAQLNTSTATVLLRKLTDGTIANQRPDGMEMKRALAAAVITPAGEVRFNIGCYCSTPLAHERATVLDEHFDNLQIDPTGSPEELSGENFMDHLHTVANTKKMS